MSNPAIESAVAQFRTLLEEQLQRVDLLKSHAEEWTDFATKKTIVIGICPGDGIGPEISRHAKTVLEHLLEIPIQQGHIQFKEIDGLTIENRVAAMKAIPDAVLAELKTCDVILKGPTTTPQKGDPWPNIESANVAMRRELDLFANVRPVRVPAKGIDWLFFRENTEGEYMLGSKGIEVTPDYWVDFKAASRPGTERICRLAFEYARQNGKKRVTVVTKSNVIKTTDGHFSAVARDLAAQYKADGIVLDEWYVDIMSAKLIDPERQSHFQVLILPNLYGDILTDEAGQVQGGVGTAGSANIGMRWSMFEAIHGSAPRMVKEGRGHYADPSSMIKAAAMLLAHIGYGTLSDRLEKALDICANLERKKVITGRTHGVTGAEFAAYVLDWVRNPELETAWNEFQRRKS